MNPTAPVPPHFSERSGQLVIGDRTAAELVEEAGGTPLFVYDNNIVGGQIARFRAAMPDGVALHYAVTANPYGPLLQFAARYVEAFRLVSLGEYERLREAAVEGVAANFAGNAKSDEELEAAVAAGATISVASESEAARAIEAGAKLGIQPKIAVYVNPASGRNPCGVDAARVPNLVAGLVEAGVDWRGLHMTRAETSLDGDALAAAHREALRQAGEIASHIAEPVPELNLGGGFSKHIDLYRLGNALHESLRTAPGSLATTRVSIELGRWLVAEAGVSLVRVLDRRESGGTTFLVTDGGSHHLSAARPGEGRGSAHPVALASRFGAAADETVTVTGCQASPFDLLAEDVALPRAEPGDIIAIFGAGAYGPTASPRDLESRPAAREMLV